MIEVEDLGLNGAQLLHLPRFRDARGWFSETFNERWLDRIGVATRFVQDNLSWSEHRYTLRGLHAQRSPMAQAKLVTVLSGMMFDVVIDARSGSPSYGEMRALTLSAGQSAMLYVPAGFCHGFLTIEPSTTVLYKVDNFYSPAHETGVRWDDPTLNIAWPLDGNSPILSDKDRELPALADFTPL